MPSNHSIGSPHLPSPGASLTHALACLHLPITLHCTACDLLRAQQHLEEDNDRGGINEIAQQLAFSDLILLNKTDLVDKHQMERVKSAVRRINQSAKLYECQLNQEDHRPPLSLLLDNNSFSVNKALKVDPEFLHSDSGSDLDDSSSSSDSEDEGDDDDDDGEGAAEGGCAAAAPAGEGGVDDIPSQPSSKAAAAAAATAAAAAGSSRASVAPVAEGSSAQQACCGGSIHKQQQKQQVAAAAAAAETEQAESSQLTCATAVGSHGQKRVAPGSCTAVDSSAQYIKVRIGGKQGEAVVVGAPRHGTTCHGATAPNSL